MRNNLTAIGLSALLGALVSLPSFADEVVASAAGGWFAVDGREVKDTTWEGGEIVGGATNVLLQSSPNAWSEAGGGGSATITWESTSGNGGTVAAETTAENVWWTPEERSGTNTLTYTSGSVVKTAQFVVVYVQPDGGPYTEVVGGIEWTYMVIDGVAEVAGVARGIAGEVTVPSVLGGRSVTGIGTKAMAGCEGLTSVTIPSGVTRIGAESFYGCPLLADVVFEGETVSAIAGDAFAQCNWDLVVHVPNGWTGRSTTLFGHSVVRDGAEDPLRVELTVTNVVVQYVLNSIKPEIAVPVSGDTGFVAVITEVRSSGAVSVPIEWKANYPLFETMYGSDFGKALMMKSGKRDGAGNDMLVWQDYVAGTDPTDPDDRFTASVTIVEGVPVISWTPELPAEQAALRKYTICGKAKLQDAEWSVVNGDEANYNFFKVTVEMK